MVEKNFEPLKRFLKAQELDYELTELHEGNINVSEKNGFYIYNYCQNVLVPRDDPIIRICRGLVLNNAGLVFNMPFNRFFNAHEPECDSIDWSTAIIQEKFDGSLISVWWTGSEWEVTTRGSFYPNENAHNFKETFKRIFNNFNKLQIDFCYMFELVSRDNRIVTKYDEEFVALLGRRNIGTLRETGQPHLDTIAKEIVVRRPRRYNATSVKECKQLFEKFNDDEEGLVVVDKNFKRMKIKQESYLKMAKIVSMKDQDVLDYILGRTELDADFTDMPELKEKMESVFKIYDAVETYAYNVYNNIKHIESQKDFAERALKYKISSVLFSLRKGTHFKGINIRYDRMKEYYDSIVKPQDGKMILLRGVPGSGKSSWIKENNLGIYAVSMDALRLMFQTPKDGISQDNNSRVWSIFIEMIENRLKTNSFTIIDAMNLTEKDVKPYRKLAEKYGFEVEDILFDIDKDEAERRNESRESFRRVPQFVIDKAFDKLNGNSNSNIYKP